MADTKCRIIIHFWSHTKDIRFYHLWWAAEYLLSAALSSCIHQTIYWLMWCTFTFSAEYGVATINWKCDSLSNCHYHPTMTNSMCVTLSLFCHVAGHLLHGKSDDDAEPSLNLWYYSYSLQQDSIYLLHVTWSISCISIIDNSAFFYTDMCHYTRGEEYFLCFLTKYITNVSKINITKRY